MNTADYAILVGISRYPRLGEGGAPADLRGPGNDVDAMKAWLLDPEGGALPAANVHEVRSAADGDSRPTELDLEAVLATLDATAQVNRSEGRGQVVGRRLYLFMSGHGFSPSRQRACLITANAEQRCMNNVHATGWLSWLQDAGYFREYVLWMDCCMNRQSFLQPKDPPFPLVAGNTAPGASFVAFAAQRPLRAVEAAIPEDGGRFHGLFTWTLLEGLRGAAADANARVTGRSLADWVRNAMAARLSDHDDVDVAKDPEIIQEDPGLVFARGVPRRSYQVRLSFPPGTPPGTGRLWSGTPAAVVQELAVGTDAVTLSLAPGLYLAEVPHAGLRQGFEVVRPTEVLVDERGPAVVGPAPGAVFQLDVDPGNPAAEIFVIDGQFSLADTYPGRLSTKLPFGLFKVKTRVGRATTQRVIMLDRDRPPIDGAGNAMAVPTVVPIRGTTATHEYHEAGVDAAVSAAAALGLAGARATLTVMARAFAAPAGGAAIPPWRGVTVVDAAGATVLDLEQEGDRHEHDDPHARCTKRVAPGGYFLRQRLDGGEGIEQSVVVCDGWAHELHVLRWARGDPGGSRGRPRVSVVMRPLANPTTDPHRDRLIELARLALADERRILGVELELLLLEKFQNPIAGLIGGHLLIVERERDAGRDVRMLPVVVRNLRGLIGADHPDVVALALQCPDPDLQPTAPLSALPMFQRSWTLLVRAAQQRPDLIPAALWRRMEAHAALPPYLVWATDEAMRTAARSFLFDALVAEPATQARRAAPHVPRVAFAVPPSPAPPPGMLGSESSPAWQSIPAVLRSWTPSRLRTPEAEARAKRMDLPPSALDALAEEFEPP